MNCLHSFRTKQKKLKHIKGSENKDFCCVETTSEDNEILCINQCQKFDKKTPFMIYADLEPLMEKIDGCKINPEKLSKIKVGEHYQVFQCLQYFQLKT